MIHHLASFGRQIAESILVVALLCGLIPAQAPTSRDELQASKSNPAGTDSPSSQAAPAHTSGAGDSYVIGSGDQLAINVWKEPEITRVVPVRSDGRISLPLVGEVQASGRSPKQLEEAITAKLKDFVADPDVTVIVQEAKSQKFNVLGMVMKPGSYPLTNQTTVLDAIATAGGFRDFAKRKDIYVLRRAPDGAQTRLPFNYKEVVKGKNSTQNVALQANDTVVIP